MSNILTFVLLFKKVLYSPYKIKLSFKGGISIGFIGSTGVGSCSLGCSSIFLFALH
jgi:hypothetical protein